MGRNSTDVEPAEQPYDSGVEDFLGFAGMVAPDAPVSEAGTENAMRLRAYSQLCGAALERSDPFIGRFRQEHLPGGTVLQPAEMPEWLFGTAAAEWPPTRVLMDVRWDTLLEQADGSVVLPGRRAQSLRDRTPEYFFGLTQEEVVRLEGEGGPYEGMPRLKYILLYALVLGANRAVSPLPVRWGGVLDKLRTFALRFRRSKYWAWRDDPSVDVDERKAWDLARITTFVLTSYVPLLSEKQLPVLTGRGNRRQTAKHLQLAVFTGQRLDDNIRVRMETWNEQYPKWAYREVTNFGWDSREAVRRLVQGIQGELVDKMILSELTRNAEPVRPLELRAFTNTVSGPEGGSS